MSFNELVINFLENLNRIVYLKNNSNKFILTKDEQNNLKQEIEQLKETLISTANDLTNDKIKYLNAKQINELELDEIITNLNKNNKTKQNNDNQKYKANLTELNHKIYGLQANLNTSKSSLKSHTLKKYTQIKDNEKLIEEAAYLNTNHFTNLYEDTKINYETFINKIIDEFKTEQDKIHSLYSRNKLISDETNRQQNKEINEQIEKLNEEIKKCEVEKVTKQKQLEKDIILESVKLNNTITELTKIKNNDLKSEKEKKQIKDQDIDNQENFFEQNNAKKTKSILDDFVLRLQDLDDEQANIQKNYTLDLEHIYREHYYTYYHTLNEFNKYLLKNTNHLEESVGLKKANKKLYNLKVKSYKDQLKSLEYNFKSQVNDFKKSYETNLKRLRNQKNISEINKNYEIKILQTELKTQKNNLDILETYLQKQFIYANKTINDNYTLKANTARNETFIKQEKLQQEKSELTIKYEIKIDELQKQKKILINKLEMINKIHEAKAALDYDNYQNKMKLNKVKANLILDKNKFLDLYNKYLKDYNLKIIETKTYNQKAIVNEKNNDLNTNFKLHLDKYNSDFNLNASEYRRQIDINKINFDHLTKQNNYILNKNLSLISLNSERKEFRYDSLMITKEATTFFSIVTKFMNLYKNTFASLKSKILSYDSNYLNLILELLKVININISNFTDLFFDSEASYIDNRLENISRFKYKPMIDKINESYDEKTTKINNTLNSIDDTIRKYDLTKEEYIKEIEKLKNKIPAKTTTLQKLTFNYDIEANNKIKYNLKLIKKINKKKTTLQKLKEKFKKKLLLLTFIHDKELNKIDRQKRRQYRSYYQLLDKALAEKKNYLNKINSILILNPKANEKYDYILNLEQTISKITNVNNTILKYLNTIFNQFKYETEKSFVLAKNRFNNSYKRNIKTNIKENKKRLNKLEKEYQKNINKESNKLKLNNKQINKQKELYLYNINYLEKDYALKYHNLKHEYAKKTKLFYQNIDALNNNIIYLDNKQKIDSYYLLKHYYKLEKTYKHINKVNLNKLAKESALFKNRTKLDLANLPIISKKNILEYNNKIKEDKKFFNQKRISLKQDLDISKATYEKDKTINIENNMHQLLEEKIKHSFNIKKIRHGQNE